MGLNLEWKRFTTWNMTDYMKTEIAVLKRITPEIPVTTDFIEVISRSGLPGTGKGTGSYFLGQLSQIP